MSQTTPKRNREVECPGAPERKRPATEITNELRIRIPKISRVEEEEFLEPWPKMPPIIGRLNTGLTPCFGPGEYSEDEN
jgi:hypothetical protein